VLSFEEQKVLQSLERLDDKLKGLLLNQLTKRKHLPVAEVLNNALIVSQNGCQGCGTFPAVSVCSS